ncbi:response regulator [Paenibacillus harenae]|uniref:response regulator n=1 Tax=Paenibacillus harenae TaxID=306543 RepID=UPI001FDED424|nr:response regulator [Paenibacillus harenae]
MSMRTKGLILIVLISFIPLLIAGVGNYSAVKQAILHSEIEKTTSKLRSRANDMASWIAVLKAEVLVISRTEMVRFGTDQERLDYFNAELTRSGSPYYSIGFIDSGGRSRNMKGETLGMGEEPFFKEAMKGQVMLTDPYTPEFSDAPLSFIAVPVYGNSNEAKGVVYASILFSKLLEYVAAEGESAVTRILFNDDGAMLFRSDSTRMDSYLSYREGYPLNPVVDSMLETNEGMVRVAINGKDYAAFHTKVSGTPWRISLQEPMAKLGESLNPIFWRIFTMIAVAEVIIVIFFLLYFERIIKRLENILGVTEQAAAGRFEAEHLAVEPHDEVGQLAHSVNGMMVHLQEMFDRLEAIINQNQYGFIVLDNNYKVSYLNKTAEDMLGYKTEELAGIATPLLFMDMDEIHAEAERLSARLGREVKPGLEVFKELRNENFSYEREWTFIHKDGTKIPTLHSSNGLRDRNGRFSGVVGMVLDVSDRKHVEIARNRLLDIVESAKDLIASADTDGKIIYMNRAGREMMGIGSVMDGGYKVKSFLQKSMYAELVKGAELAKENGYWESGVQLRKESGDTLHVSMVVVAHQNEHTGELYYSCIARDISEQQMIQSKLVQATHEAEEANQAKSRFLALMSHEIRTPLNGIIGLAQLMRKTGLSASQKDYVDKMNTSSETLLRIINDILDFSKIEAGKVDLERLPFQPEELMHRLTNQLSVFLGGKEQFEFIIDMPEDLPQTIIGDAMRLEQVLLNLCMNAIKFTNRGSVELKLEVAEETDSIVYIRFLVADTGIGMNEKQVEKLFKPFTQADGSTTRKFGGTGLGLVISHSLVELMGGKLEAASEARVGSQFYFTIPFGFTHKYSGQRRQVNDEMREQPLWIVEDDKGMAEHWSHIVEAFGLTPIVFHSWKRARDRLRRIGAGALPRLIVLDMEMPDMYGAETWLEFHEEAEAAGVKTIAMTTSYGRDEMMQLPGEQRPLTLLIKPILRTDMLRAIDNALEQKRAEGKGQEDEASPVPVTGAGSHTRILLAEDNKINQLVAIEILKEQGYEVGLAENGQEVLRKLEERHWDLILMDIHMPVMDGTEAVRMIRGQEKYNEIPIIAVTANVLRNDHEHYLKLGMNDIVTKPISSERLHTVISYWLKEGRELIRKTGSLPIPSREDSALLPAIAGMDVESALDRVNGKLPILLHMMEQFSLDYEWFADQLRTMLLQPELDNMKRMIHTLKGAAGYLSAFELQEAALEADRLARHPNPDRELLRASIDVLEMALKRLLEGIRSVPNMFDNKP